MYLKFQGYLVHLFNVGWKLALEKIAVSMRNKTKIGNTKTQNIFVPFIRNRQVPS